MDTHTHKKNHNNNKTVQDGNKDWMNSAKRHAKHRGNMLLTTGKQMYQRDMSFSDDLRTIQSLYRNTYQYIYIYISQLSHWNVFIAKNKQNKDPKQ